MSDDYYIYRDQSRELLNINKFLKRNTLGSILNKLIWLKENDGTIDHAIEYVRSELKDC